MWFYRSPTVVYGDDALSFLESIDMKAVLIVTDRNISKSGILEKVKAHIFSPSVETIDYIKEEPSVDEINDAVEKIGNFKPDTIIGLGGGSSMDAAKVILFRLSRPDLDFFDLTPLSYLGIKKNHKFIAIPTTAGTGSECSWAAVVTDRNDGRKAEMASPEIMPDFAILDPSMVSGMPAEVRRNTATDALTHAIEAYVSTWKNPYSDSLAREAVMLITSGCAKLHDDPENMEYNSMVQIGASMAGSAFSNSQIGLAHALGHAFGAVFHKPHGLSVGIFLPRVIEFNDVSCHDRYEEINSFFSTDLRKENLEESVKSFLKFMGLPLYVEDAGIDVDEYMTRKKVVADLCFESTGIIGNPRDVSRSDIDKILSDMIHK
ncbi:MAG: iron-containing alcohol dehydrogenase [Candidatus Thermoplasmatota archaeon]|nr:iron-containing alcohol dehydrogenase [Candidatus Thermoplasmatota archaeon]